MKRFDQPPKAQDGSAVGWSEVATLTRLRRQHDPELPARELVAEGTLAQIVTLLSRIDLVARHDLLISLPNRSAPPVRYEPEDFIDLLFRKDRPKAS